MNPKTNPILFIFCLMILNIGQLFAQTNNKSNALNNYSFDLFRETKIEMENLFLSPLSTYYALLMAYEGSKNTTKQEFEKVLYLKRPGSLKNDFLQLAGKPDNSSDLNVSNAIWIDKSIQVEDSYRNAVVRNYFSDIKQTEFKNTQLAVSEINKWVSELTNQRIGEIVNASNINSLTKVLISNAVYFNGEWLNKFDKQKTISAPFFSSAENQYKIDFMNMSESLQYYENEEYQFISKPYKDSDLSLCIILPKKLFGIEEIEDKMNSDFFNKIFDSTYSKEISLTIPKLKLEASYELSDALKKAGLKTAFTSEADFSGITNEAPLMLDQVLHKTWIELDEEKTEATAATAIVMRITGTGQPSYKIFKADHPFVFFIIDNKTRAILFMGRYVEPVNVERISENDKNLILNLESRKQENFSAGSESQKILYVIDNKIISQDKILILNPENIESLKVIKDKEEIRKYSSENYDGAFIITLKKKKKKKKTVTYNC